VLRQRCSEPERDSGAVVRCARVAAALLAVLAVRVVLSDAGHATRVQLARPWILIAVALGAGVILREVGRGLALQLPRPRWSASFAAAWAGSSGLLATVLLVSGGSPGSGVSVAVAVCVGLALAASLPGARRLLRVFRRLRGRMPPPRRIAVVPNSCALTLRSPAPAPLLAGWSDRGPPPRLS
jgi:peptidoglycan/LPS O-acetylase OafA/YrhL